VPEGALRALVGAVSNRRLIIVIMHDGLVPNLLRSRCDRPCLVITQK
jgi:hypothetical protein